MVRRSIERYAAPALASTGLLWGAISVLDSYRLAGSLFGPLLALAALGVALARRREWRPYAAALLLALAYSASARTLIEFRADSASYFAYIRSVTFDRDLDFRNEWAALANAERPPEIAERALNVFSAGPAVVWAPFYWVAHGYVLLDRALGGQIHEADGYSLPYRRATALGTVTVVVLGALLWGLALSRSFGSAISILSVAAAALASPVLYYTFHVPAMSHGVTFGLACAVLWAWERARRTPSLSSWVLLGGLFGLLTSCRWQAALYGLLVAPLALSELRRRELRLSWILTAGAAALLAFSPQMIAWKIGFGHVLLIPQGRGFLDFGSPNWLNTLVSADHGFFNWTPVMLLGFAGLWLGLRRDFMLCASALVVFFATVWVNGSVPAHDWAAGDAFGARRYSLVVPLMALGLAQILVTSTALLRRRPLLAPAAVLAGFVFWNLGFVSHFRARKYPEMAPLERLASDQARSLRSSVQDLFGAIAGARGRAFAYKILSAEYMYTGFNRSGRILLRSADERYLLHGWHTPSRRVARRTFRRALYPEACVRIPLESPFELRVIISARAPEGVEPQELTLVVNRARVASSALGSDWRDLPFVIPNEVLVPGENSLCLLFSNGLPPDGDGRRVAAEVEKVQLP